MRQEETIRREILEQRIDRELEALSEKLFGKKLEDASDEQVYVALLYLCLLYTSHEARAGSGGLQ